MKTVFSEGNHSLLGRTLADNEEKEEEETKKWGGRGELEAFIVLNQKPFFLWKKFSKWASCQVTPWKQGQLRQHDTPYPKMLKFRICWTSQAIFQMFGVWHGPGSWLGSFPEGLSKCSYFYFHFLAVNIRLAPNSACDPVRYFQILNIPTSFHEIDRNFRVLSSCSVLRAGAHSLLSVPHAWGGTGWLWQRWRGDHVMCGVTQKQECWLERPQGDETADFTVLKGWHTERN